MPLRAHFEEEKRLIREDVLNMGILVEEDLRKALIAFKTYNQDLAKEVKSNDEAVNAFQVTVEDRCARLIATQQPVAQDLRWLVASIKIVEELERIGDHAVHLAKASLKMKDEPYIKPLVLLEHMAENGCIMIKGAVEAYLELSSEKARQTAAIDDAIDIDHKELVTELLKYLQKNPKKARLGTKIIQTSGYLERLGDHVTNICESIIYCIDGKHIELNE